jgi:site-specific recombinase XerD
MTLRDYLLKEHTEETVKIYLRDIRVFLDYLPEPKAEKATYQDIMNYVDHLRKQYQNPRTINRMLYGVKAWYHWLIQNGKRQDHPCRYLTLKRCQNPGYPVAGLVYRIRTGTVDGQERTL